MKIINKTPYQDWVVHETAKNNRNRLYKSKSGTLQLTQPDGYFILELGSDENNGVVITVTFESQFMGSLD